MNNYITPIKREFWEFRGTFTWLPVISAALISLCMIAALALYASGVINYSITDDDFHITTDSHKTHSHEERLIIERDALVEARKDLQQASDEVHQRFTEDMSVDIEKELDKAQKELDRQGIDITIKRTELRIDHGKIREEVGRQINREIERIDTKIARIDAELAQQPMHRVPPVAPVAPAAPAADGAIADAPEPAAPKASEIRRFPETVTVIERSEDVGFTDDNIESVNDVLTGFNALFSGLMLMVSIYYLLSCLYTDRKDNSILFWKSMPVSETQQVLTKLGVALVALPTIASLCALVVGIVFVILTMLYVAGYAASTSPWDILMGVELFSVAIGHWFTAMGVALWSLPFFAWLIFCSAAAKRSPFMLAILPPAVLMIAEEIIFDSNLLLELVSDRIPGIAVDDNGFSGYVRFSESGISPLGEFIASPALWVGLIVAAGITYAAIWLRNNRYEI
ncbi:hypothetical protein [Simiduia aestuariiviva]|uniref:ABC-2 type transport system permease protein n=1 Tax=Simiduia aestuariiviva TaxID=1510459 RepID=A0A839UM43_9GAMM|nr:hypothetical protein [Simiduia aestuariiviva]MBB3168922.1 ABC-2 type transport system permease protein [Simiduia aestuariiviva]